MIGETELCACGAVAQVFKKRLDGSHEACCRACWKIAPYYDIDGKPITLDEWSNLLCKPDYKRVALDRVGDYIISTVWLGLDHNYFDDSPLIFETMVFSHEGWEPGTSERYETKEQALAGHEAMKQRVIDGYVEEEEE